MREKSREKMQNTFGEQNPHKHFRGNGTPKVLNNYISQLYAKYFWGKVLMGKNYAQKYLIINPMGYAPKTFGEQNFRGNSQPKGFSSMISVCQKPKTFGQKTSPYRGFSTCPISGRGKAYAVRYCAKGEKAKKKNQRFKISNLGYANNLFLCR